jgi:hypothetical protein
VDDAPVAKIDGVVEVRSTIRSQMIATRHVRPLNVRLARRADTPASVRRTAAPEVRDAPGPRQRDAQAALLVRDVFNTPWQLEFSAC